MASRNFNKSACLFLLVFSIQGCGGTFTVTGEGDYEKQRNPRQGTSIEVKGCSAVCKQNNPDGTCAEWLEDGSERCSKKLEI